ncbi:MAG TPA: hypothetical protein VMD98_09455 [Bryocella sp.]|nr:hypothetical protein [Bryocella sp.]
MTMFTAGVGGVCMVISWAQVLMDPSAKISPKHSLALYLLTVSVSVGTAGGAVANLFYGNTRNTIWNLALVISFACVAAGTVHARNASGPGARSLQIGSVAVFLVGLVCLIGIILALPGMPLNSGG